MASTIGIGEVLRYSRPYSADAAEIDKKLQILLPSRRAGRNAAASESGINPIRAPAKDRPIPAILISSSPHKVGSESTPWQDVFRTDFGHIRYFGDNRMAGRDPAVTRGNSALLREFELQKSPHASERIKAAPMVFFRRVRIEDRSKGNVQFHGYGIVERAERIVQLDGRKRHTFANYVFDFVVFSSAEESETFDWKWIAARRDPKKSLEASLMLAPDAWKRWVRGGTSVVERYRRRVYWQMSFPDRERRLEKSARESVTLQAVYEYYTGRKGRFEAVAAYVTQRILGFAGGTYLPGWITPASADGGADFIGRLDIGSDMARVKLVVLGQAKCEQIDAPTADDFARTVARLRRGWLVVYVTTSNFSEAVQREVIEDQYPIMLIDGRRLATEIAAAVHERGESDSLSLLREIDSTYGDLVAIRSPEEVLQL